MVVGTLYLLHRWQLCLSSLQSQMCIVLPKGEKSIIALFMISYEVKHELKLLFECEWFYVCLYVCDNILHCSWNKSLLWVSKRLLWVLWTEMEWNNVTTHTVQQGPSRTEGDIFFCCLRGQFQPELCHLFGLWFPSLFPLLSCTIKSAIYGRKEHLMMIYLEKACPGRF